MLHAAERRWQDRTMMDDVPGETWWDDAGDLVEPANEGRGGTSWVKRRTIEGIGAFYVKRQRGYRYRSVRYPFGRPTALREMLAMRAFRRLGVATPELAHFALRHRAGEWEAVLATRALDGFVSLQDGLLAARWRSERKEHILHVLIDATQTLHRARRRHGHLYPKEIFIDDRGAQVRVCFLDLELSRRYLSTRAAAESDLRLLLPSLRNLGVEASLCRDIVERYRHAGIALRDERIAARPRQRAY